MRLAKTKLLIETAHRHLDAVPPAVIERPLIANYLAQIASVTFCSEIESHIIGIIKSRISVDGDVKLATFISYNQRSTLKRVSKTDLGKTVAMFGDGLKDEWAAEFSAAELNAYSNVVGARHSTAHGDDGDSDGQDVKIPKVTLQEVEQAIDIADRMLQRLEKVIS